jgi:hypothetical protein
MPASKDPGPQDQKADKRKKWSTPRLRLLSNNRPDNRSAAAPVRELIGQWHPATDGPDH